MKWEDFQSSQNVEDRRGGDQYADAGGGSRIGAGHLGLGTVVILGLIGYMTGINPAVLIGGAEMLNNMRGGGQVTAPRQSQRGTTGQPTDQMGQFVAKILGENEEVWSQVLPAQKNIAFQPPRLVMFDGQTEFGLRRGAIGDGAVLLPGRSQNLPRHFILSRHENAIWRRRRFRLRLCHLA